MKIITSLTGICAFQFSQDEALSKNGVPTRDIFALIGDSYKFAVRATPPAGPTDLSPFDQGFQTGEIEIEGQKFAINHLAYIPGALVVNARDTDIAETVAREVATTI